MDDESDVPNVVVIHRNITGNHVGERDCWCCPFVVISDDDWTRVDPYLNDDRMQVS